MFLDTLQIDNLKKKCNTAIIFLMYTTRICEVWHMGQYTWYTFIKKKEEEEGGVYRNITLRPELNVELLSIGNILGDRQKASQDDSTVCTKPHN
jgi:hypothetical protein